MLLEILLTTAVIGGLFGGSYYAYSRRYKRLSSKEGVSQSQLQLLMLQPKISWCRFLENVDAYGKNIAAQYQVIKKIQFTSMSMLKQKFNTQEITYARYQQAIDSTNEILQDNLVKIIPLLETLDHTEPTENAHQELIKKIEGLYSFNEQLIEKLNELIINLSQIKNLAGPSQQTTEFLLDNLGKLIERAKYY